MATKFKEITCIGEVTWAPRTFKASKKPSPPKKVACRLTRDDGSEEYHKDLAKVGAGFSDEIITRPGEKGAVRTFHRYRALDAYAVLQTNGARTIHAIKSEDVLDKLKEVVGNKRFEFLD